ncbi:hypothetical protein ACMFMG_007832 [Clarireedia jacksonii]
MKPVRSTPPPHFSAPHCRLDNMTYKQPPSQHLLPPRRRSSLRPPSHLRLLRSSSPHGRRQSRRSGRLWDIFLRRGVLFFVVFVVCQKTPSYPTLSYISTL